MFLTIKFYQKFIFRVVVRAVNANIDYGGAQITVTDEPVSAVQLLLRTITDVQLNLKPKHGIPFVYELTTKIRSEFTQQYQVFFIKYLFFKQKIIACIVGN